MLGYGAGRVLGSRSREEYCLWDPPGGVLSLEPTVWQKGGEPA